MCTTDKTRYYTDMGEAEITNGNVDEKILKELEKTTASQLDIFYLRGQVAEEERQLEEILKILKTHIKDDIQHKKIMHNALHREVVNGSKKTVPVGDLVVDNYNNLRLIRDLNKGYAMIMRHKLLFGIVAILAYLWREQLWSLLNRVGEALKITELINLL